MNNNPQLRFGKIATSTKLADRFLTVKVFEPDEDKKELGTLYFLIEITTPWHPATEIGKLIQNSVVSNYFQSGTAKTSEIRFEEALKKTNLALSAAAQKGETSWTNNINAVVAAVNNRHVHIAWTGTPRAFLLRNQSWQSIISSAENNHSANQTFENIITGDLRQEDKLFFTNFEIFRHMSETQLKSFIQNFDPISAIHEIGQYLKNKKVINVNSLAIEMVPFDKSTFQPPPELSQTIYLDQKEDFWLEKAIKKTKPVLAGTKNKLSSNWKSAITKLGPVFRRVTISIGKAVISIGRTGKKSFTNIRKTRREKALNRIKGGQPKEWDNFIEKPKQGSFLKNFISSLGKTFKFLGRQFIYLVTKQRKIAIIILLVILLIWGVNAIRVNLSKPKPNLTKIMLEAEAKKTAGNEQLSTNNQDAARTLFQEALTLLEPALQDPKTKEKAKSLYNEIQTALDQIDNIKRLSKTEPVFNFAAQDSNPQVSEITLLDKNLFAANKQNNKIYKISEVDYSTQDVFQVPADDGQAKIASTFTEEILWLTNSQNLYSLNLNNNQLEKQNLISGSWEQAVHLANYFNNLYLLSPTSNQIYKHTHTASGWSGGKEVIISKNIDIKNSVSLAIDGDIYVIDNKGICLKFTAGKIISDFKLSGLPSYPNSQIEQPVTIITNSNLNSLYILDNKVKRIIEYSKDGNYLGQYVLPSDIGDVKDLTINPITKKAYLLADNYIYQFML